MKHSDDLGQIREGLRGVSKQVFGKRHRLEIVALIGAQEPPIWSRRLARSLDVGENQAASEIANLAELGALRRFPADYDRRKMYQHAPHPIWKFSRDLLEITVRAGDPENGDANLALYWDSVLNRREQAPIRRAEDSETGG